MTCWNNARKLSVSMCHERDAGQNHNVMRATESFENVKKLKYFVAILKNKNFIVEEIKSRLNLGRVPAIIQARIS
jgi:hypothetical protein